MANELSRKELNDLLNKLKKAFTQPRLHIVNHFADLINQVDVACEVYLNPSNRTEDYQEADELPEQMESARYDQSVMVEAIKAHESECLMNFPNNEFDYIFKEEINAKINQIKETWDHVRLWEVYQDIEDCFLLVEKRIFGDKGFMFMERMGSDNEYYVVSEWENYFERFFERDVFGSVIRTERRYDQTPFGVLIAWQGAFLPRVPFYWGKLQYFFTSSSDAMIFRTAIGNFLSVTAYTDASPIHHVLSKHALEMGFLKYYISHLEVYKIPVFSINVTEAKANYKQLSLSGWRNESGSELESLAPDVFQGFTNLKQLDLKDHHLKRLPVTCFNGLSNLACLDLSHNQLSILCPDLFQGLLNLKHLELNHNKLSSLGSNTFTGLNNLMYLSISDNQLEFIDPDAFQPLRKLSHLRLRNNKLQSLDSGVFKDLNSLCNLNLVGNEFAPLHPDIFKQLSKFNLIMEFQSLTRETFIFSPRQHLMNESKEMCEALTKGLLDLNANKFKPMCDECYLNDECYMNRL